MKSWLSGLLCVIVVLIVESVLVGSFGETSDQKLRRESVVIEKSGSGTVVIIFDTADHETVIPALLCEYPAIERIHFTIPQGNRMWEWKFDDALKIRKQYKQAFPKTVFTVYEGAF